MEQVRQRIALDDLRFFAYHGYYPEEQVLGNEFIVAIHVAFNMYGQPADKLHRTVNYETLYEIARTEMQQPRKLLETVAEAILSRTREEFSLVDEIEVIICKNNPPFGADRAKATVSLVWKQS